MSAILDFSADFRQDPRARNGTTRKSDSCKQSVSSDIDKENIIENSNSKIYNKSVLINTYVQRFGKSLDLENLPSPVIEFLEQFCAENDRFHAQSQSFIDENQNLRVKNDQLEKEKERLKSQLNNAQQDVASQINRMSALQAEHRETRNHWLNEKNELETKYFQIQTLLTQTKASFIKKEKEFDKLQGQLSKVIKDSSRGQKSTIVISKPLQKQLTQTKVTTLKDAELSAANSTITQLETENQDLKQTLSELTNKIDHLQINLAELLSFRASSNYALNELSPQAAAAAASSSSIKGLGAAGNLVKTYLEGTPGVRPIKFIMKEASSRVKLLLEKSAELLDKADSLKENTTESSEIESVDSELILSLQEKLAEALSVINEQDRLIHDALMSKLPNNSEKWAEDFEFQPRLTDNMGLFSPVYGIFSPKMPRPGRLSVNGRLSMDGETLLKDFLPPASPNTLSVLESSGWAILPNKI